MRVLAVLLASVSVAYGVEVNTAHKPLDAREATALESILKEVKPASITIICGGSWCRDLATSVALEFTAARWRVTEIRHGGMGIDGVSDIRIDSCGFQAKDMAKLLKRATPRKFEVMDGDDCKADNREIFLVIGTP